MSANPDSQQVSDLLEQALKLWYQEDGNVSLDHALPFLMRQIKANWSGSRTPAVRQLVNQLLLNLLDMLSSRDAEAATLLRRRYIDDETGFAVANSLGISESAFYRRRREALLALVELAIAREAETKLSHVTRLESRLEPPSYHQLFGLTDLHNRVRTLLCEKTDIRIICLAGIGGIGKTSLADALAREVIARNCFDEIAWVCARQQQFALWGEIQEIDRPALTPNELVIALDQQLSGALSPPRPPAERLSALRARLAEQSHLIILDNLETAADYQELLPLLRELSQGAWVLLTSRVSIHDQPGIYTVNLAEMESADAEALIRNEAFRRGIDDLAQASPETISQIHSIAGGNPLALKLIIGQVQVRSLPTVLEDLKEARGRRVEALYDYIYRRAWDLLDEVARRVLLTMPLVTTPGTTIDHLAGVTSLGHDALYDALDMLIRLSLVDVGGPLNERRYAIHRLTETFLHKQVTKWV